MGQTGLTFQDANAIFTNQAGLGYIDRASVTAFGEQRFALQELGQYAFGLALPTNSGTFGLSISHFGFEGYNEQRAGLAYGRKLAERFALGAQIIVLNTQIPEYGRRTVLTFELGAIVELLPELQFGVHLYSPIRVEQANGDYLPSILKVGVQYQPSAQIRLLAEVEKDIAYPVRTKVGLEYQVAEPFWLRVGAGTQPAGVSFGVGYEVADRLRFDVATNYHQLLGFTPAGGVLYLF